MRIKQRREKRKKKKKEKLTPTEMESKERHTQPLVHACTGHAPCRTQQSSIGRTKLVHVKHPNGPIPAASAIGSDGKSADRGTSGPSLGQIALHSSVIT